MTNKEAIEILDTLIYGIVSPKEEEALNLAIKALEERPLMMSCFNCKYDYISAVDEPCRYCDKYCEWQVKGGKEGGGNK